MEVGGGDGLKGNVAFIIREIQELLEPIGLHGPASLEPFTNAAWSYQNICPQAKEPTLPPAPSDHIENGIELPFLFSFFSSLHLFSEAYNPRRLVSSAKISFASHLPVTDDITVFHRICPGRSHGKGWRL